jgi:hypothetical protein
VLEQATSATPLLDGRCVAIAIVAAAADPVIQ